MESNHPLWSVQEEAVARAAFQRACLRTSEALIEAVQQQANQVETLDALWQLHDFLSIQRHVIEGRTDFRLDNILFVFASFVKEGTMQLEELDGLDAEKLSKVAAMARF